MNDVRNVIHRGLRNHEQSRKKSQEKRDFVEQARKMGWTGKSYKKAKKFERRLARGLVRLS